MSAEKPAPHSPKLQEYLQAWGTSIGRVLQEVAGAPHTWQELSPEATQALARIAEGEQRRRPIRGDPAPRQGTRDLYCRRKMRCGWRSCCWRSRRTAVR